jgi:hypothetical protein
MNNNYILKMFIFKLHNTHLNVLNMAVPRLTWLVAGLSPWRPGFMPQSVHVGFVVDEVTLGQVSLPKFFGFPLSISLELHTHLRDEQ